jgi:hypothetical protein
MTEAKRRVVGVEPWLPWPLSASPWWTRPVPAERLAALRIGLAGCLLLDILLTYAPHLDTFYGPGAWGDPAIFAWRAEPPRLNWSLLRGVGDATNSLLALVVWLVAGAWIAFILCTRPPRRALRVALPVWLASGALVALGVWARQLGGDLDPWLRWLGPWQDEPALLVTAQVLWAGSALLLLVGWRTRLAAVAAWVLSISFANLNPNVDNAGDVVRAIILFYLMLCPCGAAWSLDARGEREPAYVWPWPIRLLLVQMATIYCCNGLYKLLGTDWATGQSMYYVLGDLTLTRVSAAQLGVPMWLSRPLSWLVLGWEVGFPAWVLWRRTRLAALVFGVAFHVGILATMELGPFVPYMLCLYLPLVPWERRVNASSSPP